MAHVYPAPEQHVADGIETGRRRRETFAQIPEWVALADIPPQALALYVRLYMHVNNGRDDGVVWPGMATLAAMMGYRRRQSVMPYLKALEALGALDIRRIKTPTGNRNLYVVHEVPPEYHTGPRSLAEFYRARYAEQDAERERETMCATANMGEYATAHDPSCATAHTNQTNLNQTKRTTRSTPPGEDDCASVGHEQVRDLWLKRPDDLEQLDPGHVAERLTGVFAKALKARGVIATQDARDKIGESVKAAFDEGMSHDQVWRAFCSLLDNAWHGRNAHGWLVADAGVGTRQWAA